MKQNIKGKIDEYVILIKLSCFNLNEHATDSPLLLMYTQKYRYFIDLTMNSFFLPKFYITLF